MKITIIHGQNHKGCSYNIGRILANKLAEETEIHEFFLPKDMPEFCCGCVNCIMIDESKCPHYDYMKIITDRIDKADLLIFTTPVYAFHTSGSMKALLDHLSYRWMTHRPDARMFSKQTVIISTAAGGGMKSAIKDIKDSLRYWGAAKIYTYGVAVAAPSWEEVKKGKSKKINQKIDNLAKMITKRNGTVRSNTGTKLIFHLMRMMQKNAWNLRDNEYWEKNGWLAKTRPWR